MKSILRYIHREKAVTPHNKSYSAAAAQATRALAFLSGVFFVLLVILIVSHEVLLFKSQPMNGAFQLYNPLRRLAAGEVIGRDFDFFHGSGTLLLHYPLYLLFGGDLLASELSRKIMCPLAFFACFHLCAAAWKTSGFLASLAACVVMIVGEGLQIGSGALTGTSMIGLRSTLPAVILPAAILLRERFAIFRQPAGFHSFLGCALAIAIFVATEQGLAALGVYSILILLIPLMTYSWKSRALWTTLTVLIAALGFFALSAVVSHGQLGESLAFTLTDLPKEQFWYFGAAPNQIPELPGMLWHHKIVVGVWLPLILLGAECMRIRKTGALTRMPVDSVLVFALLGVALVVQLPQLVSYSHYESVSFRNMGLVVMLWAFRMMQLPKIADIPFLAGLQERKLMIPLLSVGTLLALTALAIVATHLSEKRKRESGGIQYDGMALSKGWASDLAAWDSLEADGSKVASTYRALIEAKNGSLFKGPDYIIHALGSRRERFLNHLKSYEPDYFLTLNPGFSQYEEWLQLRHWDVYQYLIFHYAPATVSEHHVFWKRRTEVTPSETGTIIATSDVDGLWTTPANVGNDCVYTVVVSYSTENPCSFIPVVGKLPRYLVSRNSASITGTRVGIPASLPPTERKWEFPIILRKGEHGRFALEVKMQVPAIRARVYSIELTPVSRDSRTIGALADSSHLDQMTTNQAK